MNKNVRDKVSELAPIVYNEIVKEIDNAEYREHNDSMLEIIKFIRLILTDEITEFDIEDLRELIWGKDIQSPTIKEYKEHHESITKLLKYVDEQIIPNMQ